MTILLIFIAILLIVVLVLGISFWSALPEKPPSEKDEVNEYRHNSGASSRGEKRDSGS